MNNFLVCGRDVLDLQVFLPGFLDACIQLGMAFLGLPWPRTTVAEHLFDLLQGLSAGFGVATAEVN